MVDVLNYSIARFRPLPETGEFANIGIVASTQNEFAFKIVPKRYRRVSQFFNVISPKIFPFSVDTLSKEVGEAKQGVNNRSLHPEHALKQLVHRNNETTIVFSEIRVSLLSGSIDDTVDELYSRYIGRNFVSAEYVEQAMARRIRTLLRQRGIVGFREDIVDDGILQVKFPFVSRARGLRVIKPIALTQKTALGVIDHAATWHDRIAFLLRKNALEKQKVLLPLATSESEGDYATAEAQASAKEKLMSLGVQVISDEDHFHLVEFARKGSIPEERWLYN